MSAWDKIYCELCENILTNGVQVANRTGIDTIKLIKCWRRISNLDHKTAVYSSSGP